MREYDNTIVGSKEDYNDMMANKEEYIYYMSNSNQQQEQINIELDEKIAERYSNLVINHSSSEFVLDFVSIMPVFLKQKSRIVLTPQHAKVVKGENIHRFEVAHGEIKTLNRHQYRLILVRQDKHILKGSRNGAFFMD
jgi:hypothetical protein